MSGFESPGGDRQVLGNIARDVHDEFRGIFSESTIAQLVGDTYAEFARSATITRWLALGTEVSVRRRLRTLAAGHSPSGHKPAVLFVSQHDAGASQIASMWFEHLVGDQAEVWSTGPNPSPALASAIAGVMAEVGIVVPTRSPLVYSDELTRAADAVVTIGHGDSCLLIPGRHYEDWDLDAPVDATVAEIRQMRDQIRELVTHLTREVGVAAA